MSLHQKTIAVVASAALMLCPGRACRLGAQTQPAPAATAAAAAEAPAPALLTAAELQTLIARIALYPDDLVALVLSAALNPLQIVQAARFQDQAKAKPDAKPDPSWDGSVISLLNYPTVLTMMNDDLEWTKQLGEAVVNQQKDVLVAIQELRDKAVDNGTIKSDDKVVVETNDDDNVIIRPAKKEVTYVPTYDPVILTSPTYVATAPIVYGDPYPSYYYPYAPYWSGFITGAVFGAAVDWDNWHSWGGNDVDINIGEYQSQRFPISTRTISTTSISTAANSISTSDSITNNVRENRGNRLDLRENGGGRLGNLGGLAGAGSQGCGWRIGSRIQSSDVRRDVQNQLKQRDGGNFAGNRSRSRCKSCRPIAISGKVQARATATSDRAQGQPPESMTGPMQPSRTALGKSRQAAASITVRGSQAPSAIMALVGMLALSSQRGNASLGGGGGRPRAQDGGGARVQGGGQRARAVAAPGCNAAAGQRRRRSRWRRPWPSLTCRSHHHSF